MAGIFVEKLLKEGGNDPIKLRDQRGWRRGTGICPGQSIIV